MWLQLFRQLYSLETLDTRFVIPATAPPKEGLEQFHANGGKAPERQNGRPEGRSKAQSTQPSHWNTSEFYFYYLVIGVAVPYMTWCVWSVSQESHANYSKFAPLLSDGWIPGRKVDNSDAQYSAFRQNIPYLIIVALFHPFLRKAYDAFWRAGTYTQVKPNAGLGGNLTQGLTASAAADARLNQRVSFDLIFNAVFIIALHGTSAFKILLILYLNYNIAKKLPRKYVPALTWVFNLAALFANELCRGYMYSDIWAFFFRTPGSGDSNVKNWGEVLDSYGGLNPRWEVHFNFTVLRLISFNMDHYWGLHSGSSSPIEKQLDPSNLSERGRVSLSAKAADYDFRNYLAYALYAPLYIAGPILTFNDYISQSRYRASSITPLRTLLYAIRFAVVLLTMELMIHHLYMVAIFHAQPSWTSYTPAQLVMLGYFNLKHIWLKLLLPWRFFRLWSLLDGIDPPENMVRCMSDNYSVTAFWRGWHRSFNRWIIRYIYIPLGGSTSTGFVGKVRAISNYLAVFTFVAIWHDIQLRLLMWGWLITFFVVPELVASMVFPKRKWRERPNAYRWICGVGAVANILMLMAANLVGFALGLDGLDGLLRGIFGSYNGLVFFVGSCAALFVGAQVMFEVREEEARKGIHLKC